MEKWISKKVMHVHSLHSRNMYNKKSINILLLLYYEKTNIVYPLIKIEV